MEGVGALQATEIQRLVRPGGDSTTCNRIAVRRFPELQPPFGRPDWAEAQAPPRMAAEVAAIRPSAGGSSAPADQPPPAPGAGEGGLVKSSQGPFEPWVA